MATYSPERCAIAFRDVRTTEQAITLAKSGNIATLGALQRNCGVQKIAALLKLYLIELNEVLGLKSPMTEAQIDQVADEVLARYRYLTMADINLVFRRIKCGECGKLYDRLTMPQLMSIFADYDTERAEIAAQQSIAEAEYYKGDHTRSSDHARDVYQRARKMEFERAFKPKKKKGK
ncbi:MAG: hypothetical protein K2I87_07275 [Bacteroidales bacterium]|nr:hypothetical protein [Bacteroidales bacterium]